MIKEKPKMKKMNEQFDKLNAIMENIKDIISDLEEKRDSIEDKAYNEDRSMTKREQINYDYLDEQISSLEDCVYRKCYGLFGRLY